MSLVSDREDPPLQVGVMLLLDVRKGLDPVRLKELLRHRLAAVPRLRQRLINVPVGCGRPVWVDYPEFRIEDHFAAVLRAAPTDEEAVLSIAADLLTTRLPRDHPLWAARLVTGVGHHQAALLVCSTMSLPTASPGSLSSQASWTAWLRQRTSAFPAPRHRWPASRWTPYGTGSAPWSGYQPRPPGSEPPSPSLGRRFEPVQSPAH